MTTHHRVSNDALCIIAGIGQVVNNKKRRPQVIVDCVLIAKMIRHKKTRHHVTK